MITFLKVGIFGSRATIPKSLINHKDLDSDLDLDSNSLYSTTTLPTVSDSSIDADDALFERINSNSTQHVLQRYLVDRPESA